MEDDQSLSVRELLCCGIQATPNGFVDKTQFGAALDIAEASDGQGGGAFYLFGTVERVTKGSTASR